MLIFLFSAVRFDVRRSSRGEERELKERYIWNLQKLHKSRWERVKRRASLGPAENTPGDAEVVMKLVTAVHINDDDNNNLRQSKKAWRCWLSKRGGIESHNKCEALDMDGHTNARHRTASLSTMGSSGRSVIALAVM